MHIAHKAIFVYHHQRRQTAELQQFYLLSIAIGDLVRRVWQPYKWKLLLLPLAGVGVGIIRANDENDRVLRGEQIILLAQLRQMPAAVRSEKAAVEHKHHVLLPPVVRKGNGITLKICQGKIWRGDIFDDFGHNSSYM